MTGFSPRKRLSQGDVFDKGVNVGSRMRLMLEREQGEFGDHRPPRFQVRCADGAVRHKENFETSADARRWAEWGHGCTANHTIEEVP